MVISNLRILGAIIAGGESRRMGADKAFVQWRGKLLISHVIDRLEPQVERLVISTKFRPERFEAFGFDVVSDVLELDTPLAGLHAALIYAQTHGFEGVVTSPCDTPLLPLNLVWKLRGLHAAYAVHGTQKHYLTGFWPISVLEAFAKLTSPRVKDFCALVNASEVYWGLGCADPFININTAQELSDLL